MLGNIFSGIAGLLHPCGQLRELVGKLCHLVSRQAGTTTQLLHGAVTVFGKIRQFATEILYSEGGLID